MTGFRMKIIRTQNEKPVIVFRGMKVPVEEMVADFYNSDFMWPALRRDGPMLQYIAVRKAYAYLLSRFQYPDDTAFLKLAILHQRLFKGLMREFIARGLQAGLIQYRTPANVQTLNQKDANAAARSLVESRINVDAILKGSDK